MLLQLPYSVPVLDAGKQSRQTMLESKGGGVVTCSLNGFGLYLYRKSVVCSYYVQQESKQRCGNSHLPGRVFLCSFVLRGT